MATQGIGARVRRKEDARYLAGRGSFVADMMLPRQREVAFLRSPIAHGHIVHIGKPAGCESAVFLRNDIADIPDIVAHNTVPGYRSSKCPPLAQGKVRFVGEPVAMCVAPTRALAEDLCARVELELEELAVLVDAHRARTDARVRIHEEWPDNCFLTLNYESGFAGESKDAPVVVNDGGAYSNWPFTVALEPGQAIGNLPGPCACCRPRSVRGAARESRAGVCHALRQRDAQAL